MNTTREREVTLFGGECVAQGCRGRRSDLPINKNTSRWIAVIVGGLMLGFAGAATAIHRYPTPQHVNASPNFDLVFSAFDTHPNFNQVFSAFDDVLW